MAAVSVTKPRVRVPALSRPMVAASSLAGSSLMGGYEGAQRNRRLFAFRPTEEAINSLLVANGSTLRARARWLARNNPYAKKARRVFVSKLIGTGIVPIPVPPPLTVVLDGETVPLKAALLSLWGDFVDEADEAGLTDFYGLQALIAGGVFEAGECFVRRKPQDSAADLAVPLQLEVLESEFCPYEMNLTAANGNPIRAGIEFDKAKPNKRVAYWFWRQHPGDLLLPSSELGYVRVPAEEVLHVFEPIRPGQIRGVSWLAAAIVRAYLLDQYEDAELERKKVAALFAGFVIKPRAEDDGAIAPQDQPVAGDSSNSLNAPGEGITGLTPGMMQVLLEGEDVRFSTPADVGPNFEAFEYRAILALCAAMDLPYFAVTGDLKQANYSSCAWAWST
jgi:lambda family phage portal protein